MRWQETSGPILRKTGASDGVVTAETVQEARPGDVDLAGMRMWHSVYKGFSYVITADPDIGPGYVASCRPINAPRTVVGDEAASPTHWLTDRDAGVPTFTAAENACKAHSRGRRDA